MSHWVAGYLAAHLGLTGLMLGALWACRRQLLSARWVLAAGIALRLATVPIDPHTSHDPQRYLWDGHVLLAGHDPWRTPPNDPAVAELRARVPTPEEHAQYPTLYPPAALAIFAACASAGVHAELAWKLVVTFASLALLFAAWGLCRATGRVDRLALVALNPLLVLEGGVGAHVDLLAAALLAVALWLEARGRRRASAGAMGAASALKLLPAAALWPSLWQGRWRIVLVAALVFALPYGLALGLGLSPLGSLPAFFDLWRFGSPLSVLRGPEALEAGVAVGVTLLALSAYLARRGSASAAMLVALLAPLCASPVVFPWYLVPLVPLLVLVPSRAVFLWSTTLPFSYEVLTGFERHGAWQPALWAWALPTAALVAGALWDLWRARRAPADVVSAYSSC